MNKEYFNSLVSSPEHTTLYDAVGLTELIKSYPYFQSAHLLLLYNLKKFNNEQFDPQLRESSIFIANRSILFDLVNQHQSITENTVSEVTEIAEPSTIPSTKKAIEFQLEEDSPVEVIAKTENLEYMNGTLSKTELLEIDDSPVVNEIAKEIAKEDSTEKPDLISKFLEENPAFVPNRLEIKDQQPDISVDSIQEPEDLITETLARIFESQKLYEKAISTYEKLILKFPEKSTYFAVRIEELRNSIK